MDLQAESHADSRADLHADLHTDLRVDLHVDFYASQISSLPGITTLLLPRKRGNDVARGAQALRGGTAYRQRCRTRVSAESYGPLPKITRSHVIREPQLLVFM